MIDDSEIMDAKHAEAGGHFHAVRFYDNEAALCRIVATFLREGLALSQLAPGPLAAQLAICLGYSHGGIWGATAVGVVFVIPSFLMTVALGALYVA